MSTTVHLGVYDGLADWEVGYAIANIHTPVWHDGGYEVVTVAESIGSVTTMGGLRITPDVALSEVRAGDSDMLILPGGRAWETGGGTAFASAAGGWLDAGVPVAAICGATLGLAAAGLLDERSHTSSALEYLTQAPTYRGSALYRDAPAVTDGDLITAGPSNPIEFAQHVFARLGLMTPDVLEAWYGLFKTGDAKHFGELLAARQATQAA